MLPSFDSALWTIQHLPLSSFGILAEPWLPSTTICNAEMLSLELCCRAWEGFSLVMEREFFLFPTTAHLSSSLLSTSHEVEELSLLLTSHVVEECYPRLIVLFWQFNIFSLPGLAFWLSPGYLLPDEVQSCSHQSCVVDLGRGLSLVMKPKFFLFPTTAHLSSSLQSYIFHHLLWS